MRFLTADISVCRKELMRMLTVLNNLKLRVKMLLAPAVVFVFLLLIAAGTYYTVSVQNNSIDDIYNSRFKGYPDQFPNPSGNDNRSVQSLQVDELDRSRL